MDATANTTQPKDDAAAAEEETQAQADSPDAAAPQSAVPADKDAELAAMKDQLLRTMAEMENVRKRAARDVEDASRYAVAAFARELIGVLENLQRASESIPAEARQADGLLKTLGEGVDLTLKGLLDAFEKHGITRSNPLGEKFDHHLHQAVVQIEDHAHPPGTVVQVMQAGYTLNGRLLRPAMVGVAKAPPASPPPLPPDGAAHVDTQA